MTEDDYLKQRVDEQIRWHSDKSQACQAAYKRLRVLEITAAALIPFLTGMGDKIPNGTWLIGALGVAIAMSTAIGTLYRHHENWIQYRMTAEALNQEKYLFVTRSGVYQDAGAAFALLVQRVETLLGGQTSQWSQTRLHKSAAGAEVAEQGA